MSQCVPNWDLDETPAAARFSRRPHSSATPQDAPPLDYEVAELTWENGQLAMHAFGPPRLPAKPQQLAADATWQEKPRGNGTLESIVNQATVAYPSRQKQQQQVNNNNNLVPWFDQGVVSASAALTMDALVPSGRNNPEKGPTVPTRVAGCSTRVASCSVGDEDAHKRAREARVGAEWSGWTHSVSVSATATAGRDRDRDSVQMTADTCEKEVGVQFTSTCMGSSDNTSSAGLPWTKATTTADDHDSVSHSRSLKDAGDEEGKKKRSGKSSVSTKRSRAAAIHNQSERKRRDKINQRMKTLQKLVPNSSKTDKASVLDEVIDYLKQLQAQVQMVNRMNMQPSAAAAAMMLPMAALQQQQQQQQLQMSMMAPMMSLAAGMGMGMPGVMDMNCLAAARPNIPGMPNLHGGATTTSPFLHPMAATWDASAGDRSLHAAASSAALMMDPMAAFLACQSQPMTLDTYSRMAAMYQQMAQQQQPPPASNSKNLS